MNNEIEKSKDNKKEFRPTIEQLKYAEVYCDIRTRIKTDTDRAKKIGISRMTIHRWKTDPEFNSWLDDRANKTIDKAKGILLLHGLRQALTQKGFNYWKVLMEITGLYTPNLRLESILKPPDLRFMYYKDDKPEAIESKEIKKIEGKKNDK